MLPGPGRREAGYLCLMRVEYTEGEADTYLLPLVARSPDEDGRTPDGVIAMLHAARSVEPYRRARIPVVNTARIADAGDVEESKKVMDLLINQFARWQMAAVISVAYPSPQAGRSST